jgi:hypothetical protein
MTKTTPTSKETGLPALSTVAADLSLARERLEELALKYEGEALADRLWIGVCCLAARELHAIDAHAQRNPSGKNQHSKQAMSRRDMASELSPDEPSPQGYMGWISTACPWLNRATTYKYSDAAEGAGFTAWTTEAQVREWCAAALAKEPLTLAALVAHAKLLKGGTPPPPRERTSFEQMTFDSLLGYAAQTEQIISCRPHMSPQQIRLAAARAYEALRELTGSPWQPADEDDKDLSEALRQAKAGGY